MKIKTQHTKMWYAANTSKEKIYNNKCLYGRKKKDLK